MPFELTLDGRVYRTDSLTLAEAEQLEAEVGKSWLELNPIKSAKEFRVIATRFLIRDLNPDKAQAIVAELTLGTAMQSVKWVDDDLPDTYDDGIPSPKADGL